MIATASTVWTVRSLLAPRDPRDRYFANVIGETFVWGWLWALTRGRGVRIAISWFCIARFHLGRSCSIRYETFSHILSLENFDNPLYGQLGTECCRP